MKHTPLIVAILIIPILLCFSGCQDQNNQNGNHTNNSTNGNQQNNTTINRFLGKWETNNISPEYESWSFYANQTVENYLVQIFEEQPLPSTSWFNYTYDATNLCFTTGASPNSSNYLSICYTYEFSQNWTKLTLSSNNIIILDLIKMNSY